MSNFRYFEAQPDDVLQIGAGFFAVDQVRDPQHPAVPGTVVEGFYWRPDRRLWNDTRSIVRLHDDMPCAVRRLSEADMTALAMPNPA